MLPVPDVHVGPLLVRVMLVECPDADEDVMFKDLALLAAVLHLDIFDGQWVHRKVLQKFG